MAGPLHVLILADSDDYLPFLEELGLNGNQLQCERIADVSAFDSTLKLREWDVVIINSLASHFGLQDALSILQSSRKKLPLFIVTDSPDNNTKRTKLADESFAHRIRYERALAACSRLLFNENDVQQTIEKTLQEFLDASGVSRVYLCENFDDPVEGPCMRRIAEVCAEGIEPQIQNPLSQQYPITKMSNYFRSALDSGQPYFGLVAYLPEEDRKILESSGVISILLQPILMGDRKFGFFGFEDCRRNRVWNEEDARLLRTGADLLGSYFQCRRMGETLQQTELRLQQVVQSLPIILYSAEGGSNRFTLFMGNSEEVLGYRNEEYLENPAVGSRSIFPEDGAYVYTTFVNGLNSLQPFELQYRMVHGKHGRLVWVHHQVHPIKNEDGTLLRQDAVLLDITKQKQIEQDLRESEQRLRELFEGINDAILVHDEEGNILDCNDVACRMLGFSREEILSLKTRDIDDPSFAGGFDNRLEHQISKGRFACEGIHVTKDGRQIPVDINSSLFSYQGQRAILSVIRDITDRKQAEKEHKRLATAIEQSGEIVVITDSDGIIQYVNPAFEQISGFTAAEAVGRSAGFMKSGKHDGSFYHELWETLLQGNVWRGHFINRKKDGSLYEEEATISPIRDVSGRIINYVAVKRDVTREVALQAQLQQSQKMEAIGHLAGGIAHDFNNVLQIIIGHTDLAGQNLIEGQPIVDNIKVIRSASESAARLTRQLLAFSRKQILQPKPANINDLINNLIKMLRRVLGEQIELKVIPAENLKPVLADPGQIEQALINLCVNARDAMPEGGTITIETKNIAVNRAFRESHPWARDPHYVRLTITDTGTGISPEVMEHIFEPFFTTKEAGKGTGLGLATVYGIVKQHQGMIQVRSEAGQGSTFEIFLPATKQTSSDLKAEISISSPAGGNETLLVAEDDEVVRNLTVHILNRAGYNLLVASDGREAVDKFLNNSDLIRMVVLDVVMPKLSGIEAFERMRKIRANLPVLFTSGYSPESVFPGPFPIDHFQMMQKPYHPNELLRRVREILDENHPVRKGI